MDQFIINYSEKSKNTKLFNLIVRVLILVVFAFFCISEVVANTYSLRFYLALIGVVISLVLLLMDLFAGNGDILKIDVNTVEFYTSKPKLIIDWANISKVNIGPSYITFQMNGLKEVKLNLSNIMYDDVKRVKSKIIELCEYKNIPYQND